MMTEEKLKEYKQLKKEVELLQNQILKLERIKTLARVPVPKTSSPGGFKNTADENLIKLDSAKIKMNETLHKYLDRLEEVDKFIRELKTPFERNIFKLRYDEGLGWEYVAVRLDSTRRVVCRVHDKILGIEYIKDEYGKVIKKSNGYKMPKET